jgi:hypothetical protein
MEPQKTTDPTFNESVTRVMQTLPPFLRAYIEQQKYTTVATMLMSKYGLRIDQGGVLELNLLLLLMGIQDPSEFTEALLIKANLDQQMVNNIVKDINDQVFIPLRKEEEELSKNTLQQQAQSRSMPPTAPHIAPLPPKMVMPGGSSLSDAVRRVAPQSSFATQVVATNLLEDHEEPSVAFTQTPSSNPPAPSAPGLGIPELRKTTPPPPLTSYSSDPYREPVDEN